jgi:predicted permease
MNAMRRRRQAGFFLWTPLAVPPILEKTHGMVLAIWTTPWERFTDEGGGSISPVALLFALTFFGGMMAVWNIGRRLEHRATEWQPRTPTGKLLWNIAVTLLVLTGLTLYGLLAFAALTFATMQAA